MLRHSLRIAADVLSYARLNRAWWIVPVLAVLVLVVALGSASQAVVPVAVYTLF